MLVPGKSKFFRSFTILGQEVLLAGLPGENKEKESLKKTKTYLATISENTNNNNVPAPVDGHLGSYTITCDV